MFYKRLDPRPDLQPFINCYWVIESDGSLDPEREKIIPDGFIEIIYHYGDSYRISLQGDWEDQHHKLLAGQIDKHFFIENTGRTGMIGIKLRPEAATLLFDIDMSHHVNKVVSIDELPTLSELSSQFDSSSYESSLANIENYFLSISERVTHHPIQDAISLIFEQHGMITIQEISNQLNISQRQLERYFKKFIGLSPKLYSRIIKFNYVFELMKNEDHNWQDLVFHSGYYDQSHFIKNFKEFTGEDPTKYGFNEKNMANFFLKKLES